MARLFPTARMLNPPPEIATGAVERPRPLNSLTASARRITTASKSSNKPKPEEWQEDAWSMYDLVGEQRFLANTLAARMGQARFFVGKVSDDPTGDPVPVDAEDAPTDSDLLAAKVFDAFGGGAAGRSQMVVRLGINLFVAGDGWVVGVPPELLPDHVRATGDDIDDDIAALLGDDLDLDELDWRCLSVDEVTVDADGSYIIHYGPNKSEQAKVSPDDVWLIRVWRPHPRRAWQADSPTRSSLGVLRELVGLTMHIGAQIDSRLAGAGLLLVPQSASDAIKAQNAAPDDADDDSDDPFTEALIEAMTTPIADRSSASAVVPLTVTVPDDTVEKFKHISFSTPLDGEARDDRTEAIRRLALGQDAPPELLLGTGGMNHWGAWLVREDVVTTHIEPPLALICDAFTTQFLWPALMELGLPEEQAREYVAWYDVAHMIVRPNRSADAQALHAVGAISDEALRDSMGFSGDDAPESMDAAVAVALEMVKSTPALMQAPGLEALVASLRAVLDAEPAPPVPVADDAANVDETPDDDNSGDDNVSEDDVPEESDAAPAPSGPPALVATGRRD